MSNVTRQQVLMPLDRLAEYIEDGIHDYVSENAITDWLDTGEGTSDIDVLRAIDKVRAYVMKDENNIDE